MAIVEIITGQDHPTLRAQTERIESFDKALSSLIEDLLDTVEDAKGAGLAAPQINISKRICIARIAGTFVPIVNPEVIWQSDHVVSGEEGCLSLPDVWLYVPRPSEAIIRYQDEKGKEQERKLAGWDARVVLHEVDHLDGKLIVDYQAQEAEDPTEAL